MSDEEEQASTERTSLVVVDPDGASRSAAEGLEEALSRPVFAVDPSEFKPADSEEIQNAAAFVLCWDLGFRCAADLIEGLRADPAYADRKILVALDAPTRRLVLLAMELGADGVCLRPWDGEALAAALERVGLPQPAAAA
ncbi:MAG: hypothetical protein U0900_00560 [Myxococcota bacterium]